MVTDWLNRYLGSAGVKDIQAHTECTTTSNRGLPAAFSLLFRFKLVSTLSPIGPLVLFPSSRTFSARPERQAREKRSTENLPQYHAASSVTQGDSKGDAKLQGDSKLGLELDEPKVAERAKRTPPSSVVLCDANNSPRCVLATAGSPATQCQASQELILTNAQLHAQ